MANPHRFFNELFFDLSSRDCNGAYRALDSALSAICAIQMAISHANLIVAFSNPEATIKGTALTAACKGSRGIYETAAKVKTTSKDPAAHLEAAKSGHKVAKDICVAVKNICDAVSKRTDKYLERALFWLQRTEDACEVTRAAIECAETGCEGTCEAARQNAREIALKRWEEATKALEAEKEQLKLQLYEAAFEKQKLEHQLSETNAVVKSEKEQLEHQLDEANAAAKSEKEQLERQIQELQRQVRELRCHEQETKAEIDESKQSIQVSKNIYFPDQMTTGDSWSLVDKEVVLDAELEDVKRKLRLKKMREQIDAAKRELVA